jgi:hypothetical protein
MNMLPLAEGRAEILDQPDGYQVVVAAPRALPAVAFLTVWLCGWAAGEGFAIAALLSSRTPLGARLFLALWLALWTFGGITALFAVLWHVAGRERLVLGPGALRLRREVLGVGFWTSLPIGEVRDVTPIGPPAGAPRPGPRAAGAGGGGILVHLGRGQMRFGLALGPGESAVIVQELKRRHAFPEPDHAPPGDGGARAA